MEQIIAIDNFVDTLAMVGKEYRFQLNSQMSPLKCVVTGVDCSRGRPLFVIDLNCDPGIGDFAPGETRLADVGAQFLFSPETYNDPTS